MTSITAIIVNYNTREHLSACLESLNNSAFYEVIVVDNSSSDGSVELVRDSYPWVRLISSQTNRGYGSGANEGIADCASDYVLLLNSDTQLEPSGPGALCTYLDQHPSVAIAGPRLINPDGTVQATCYPFPTPMHIFLQESGLGRVVGATPGLRERYLPTASHRSDRSVPWVLGAALAIRRSAFESVGGFDSTFFMYYEEVDLCYRLRSAGWQIHFAPVTTIMHVGGASTSQRRADMLVRWYASLQHFYHHHYSWVRLAMLVVVIKFIVAARLGRDLVRLRLVSDEQEQARLAENVAGSRRILLGQT